MRKKILLLAVPFLVNAESFSELEKLIDNSNVVKIYQKNIEIQKEKVNQVNGQNYGKLDFEYSYSHLFDTPIMKTNGREIEAGSKENYSSSLIYSYPIFSGFAIKNSIDIEKLNLIKSQLKLENLKRNILLKSANLYANIYAVNKKIESLNEAKKALLSAKDQAKAMFDEGLLNQSTLDEIDAKFYEIEAEIKEAIAQKKSLLNSLSYLLNKKIKSISTLPNIALKSENISNRPDIKILKTTLKITKNYENISKSNYYPKIYFQAGVKKEANNLILSKNDYQNINQSFVGVSLKYNIFNGGADKSKLNEAKLNRLKTSLYFNDYLNRVKTDYQNDILKLNALKSTLTSANKEVKARESYYNYIKAKFNENLVDVVDLNDAIAKLATSKAKREYIKSQIFFYVVKGNVDGGG